jgi:hypothetical protein
VEGLKVGISADLPLSLFSVRIHVFEGCERHGLVLLR